MRDGSVVAGSAGGADPWIREFVARALHEDVGAGDWTTLWTVPEGDLGRGELMAKEPLRVAGAEVAAAVFRELDPALTVEVRIADGEDARPGEVVMAVEGPSRGVLTGERVALNLLGHLSGIASLTRRFVEAVEGTGARIVDTRKTTPGLRVLEKAAVRAGGGENHRMGLFDMVLIKENHIAAAGGVRAALERAASRNQAGLEVEIEVTNLEELEEALGGGPHRILLDNMPPALMKEAVARADRMSAHRPLLEASGGIDLETAREVAETGVDLISVGALTHSAPSADFSLQLRTSDGGMQGAP